MSAQLTAPMEDYLEAIYELHRRQQIARVKDIARALKVKMPSVTAALRTLREEGLIRHERYGHVELTDRGREVAEEIHRRHITLVGFLTTILQLDMEQAEREACELEHSLGPVTLRRLLGMMEFIAGCPRSGGDWLTHMRGRWEDRSCDHDCARCIGQIELPEEGPFDPPVAGPGATTLDRQAPGFQGVVLRVAGSGPIRRRLMEMGVTAGTEIEFERVAPLGDPLEVKVRGYHLSLRKEEAAKVHVEPR